MVLSYCSNRTICLLKVTDQLFRVVQFENATGSGINEIDIEGTHIRANII